MNTKLQYRDIEPEIMFKFQTYHLWIPIDRRLPEPGQSVIILFKDWDDPEETVYEICLSIAIYTGKRFSIGGFLLAEVKDVSHWMPLPDPPKEW